MAAARRFSSLRQPKSSRTSRFLARPEGSAAAAMRFSLKLLLLATALLGVALAWLATLYRRGAAQMAAVEVGRNISGFIDLYYDFEVHAAGDEFPKLTKAAPPLPDWVYAWVSPERLHPIVGAEIDYPDDRVQELVPLSVLPHFKILSVDCPRYFDDEAQHFENFRQLQYLDLYWADNLTDRGLLELARLERLKVLNISGDQITEAGIQELRRKLPQCIINGRRYEKTRKE